MELWLIRHALPQRVEGADGPADPPLTDQGREQAEKMANWWAPFGVDAIYSSPMRRAVETSAPLAEATGIDPVILDGLKEFDAHSATYIPIEELRADPDLWKAAIEEWMSPEAVSGRDDFRATVLETLNTIEGGDHGRVAVVCHGGVINACLSDALQLSGALFFEPAYTSVSRVLARPGRRQVVSINEAPHLGHLVLPSVAI